MNSIYIISLLLPFTFAATPIKTVVVYSDRAEITRSGSATCSNETAELLFENLPRVLDRRTLRGDAIGKATVIGVDSKLNILTKQLNQDVENLQKQLQDLDDKLRIKSEEQQTLNERNRAMNHYAKYFQSVLKEEMRLAKPDTTRWQNALNIILKEENDLAQKSHTIEEAQQVLIQKKRLLQKQRTSLNAIPQSEAINATVILNCNGLSRVKASLSYIVPQATWNPDYDLRFIGDDQKGTVEITTAAFIRQSTGENWDNVQLSLSTAKPRLGSKAPYPAAINVAGQEKKEQKVLVQATEDRRSLSKGGRASSSSKLELDDQGSSVLLKFGSPISIRSNGHPYWMPVDKQSVKTKPTWITIPKLSPAVFQTVKFQNPAPYPLLDGALHIQRNNTYMGDHHHTYKAAGEEMEVSLGVDGEIQIKRAPISVKDKGSSLLDSNQHLKRAYRITVRNTSSQEKKIEVRENIPVSKVKDIQIELLKETTSDYVLDKERGFLSWSPTLKPNQKKVIDLYYTIHLPDSWKTQ